MNPEPPVEPAPVPVLRLPGFARGVCWSLLVAEMAAERTVPAPNPWTPDDPKEAA